MCPPNSVPNSAARPARDDFDFADLIVCPPNSVPEFAAHFSSQASRRVSVSVKHVEITYLISRQRETRWNSDFDLADLIVCPPNSVPNFAGPRVCPDFDFVDLIVHYYVGGLCHSCPQFTRNKIPPPLGTGDTCSPFPAKQIPPPPWGLGHQTTKGRLQILLMRYNLIGVGGVHPT